MKLKLIILLLLFTGAVFGQHLFEYNLRNDLNPSAKYIRKLKKSNEAHNDPKTLFLIGLCYEQLNNEDSAFAYYMKAKDEYKSQGNIDYSKEILLNIHIVISSQENYKYYGEKYINGFYDYAKKKNNPFLISLALREYGILKIEEFRKDGSNPRVLVEADKLLQESIANSIKAKNESIIAAMYTNLGTIKRYQKKVDSSRYFFHKSIEISKRKKNRYELFINYFNLGNSYFWDQDYKNALNYYKIAEAIKVPKYKKKATKMLYEKMSETYDYMNEHEERRDYQKKIEQLTDEINEEKQNINLIDFETKYETKEKELENLKLKSNIKINKIISYSSIGLLAVIIVITILAYKNLSKKKKIIEQEKLLQTQKLETTLKQQELHAIDVMLESQEKERQRIANELHDNLGSMLATLKLNFENLKRHDKQPENQLFEKTDELIEEAYQKVRNISHLKNLGVIGSEGLVVSVKKMAEKMSIIEKLHINVIPYGLSERLENTLEVMIFRIIQELCTNVIKHSEASEVNIYMTQHNGSLNIIIEDNGKGFDPKNSAEKSGIGLKNIEKKVEQMNGTFTIDSIISKGTTIIIDLPI